MWFSTAVCSRAISTLRVEVSEDRVRVNVADDGPGFDPSGLLEPSPERTGGWGLHFLT